MTDTDTVEWAKRFEADNVKFNRETAIYKALIDFDKQQHGDRKVFYFQDMALFVHEVVEAERDAAIAALPPAVPAPCDWLSIDGMIYNLVDDETRWENGKRPQMNQYMIRFERQSKAGGSDEELEALQAFFHRALSTTPDPVAEAAKVLLDAADKGLDLFDVDGPNDLLGLAAKWSGNRGDAVIQLDIAEEFMRESLRALTKDGDTCRKCGGTMSPSKAIAQTFTGVGDFHDADEVSTISAGGPGKLIDCMKCVDCGWSVTKDGGQ